MQTVARARVVYYLVLRTAGACWVSRPNYNAAKRARELKQKAKRDAKLARRQSRGHGAPVDETPGSESSVPATPIPTDPAAPQQESLPGNES